MLNILVSRLSWQPKSLGGGEISAFQHAAIFKTLGNDVWLVSNVRSQHYSESTYLPLTGQRHLQFFLAWILLPFFLVKKYDIINPHSRADQIVFSLLKTLHRTPVIWKDAGDLDHQIKINRTGFFENINQKILIKAIQKADAIYTLNNEDKENILHKLRSLGVDASNKFFVIPTSINFKDYKLDAKSPRKTEKVVIGTLGRLDISHKGLDVLVNALSQLNSSLYELWVVGDGPDNKTFKQLVEQKKVNAFFFGYQEDPSPYLKGMDIFVQPSRFEGFGRTVKEAMYFGLPVVGSRVGGIVDQVLSGNTGYLVAPGDAKKLKDKLEILIGDKDTRIRMGKAGRKKAMNDGDITKIIALQVLPLFKKYSRKHS